MHSRNCFQIAMVVLCCLAVAAMLTVTVWQSNNAMVHSVAELLCVFVALAIFMVSLMRHQTESLSSRLLGSGYLAVALIDSAHVWYFPSLRHAPPGFYDLGVRLWVLGRLTEAVVLCLAIYFIDLAPRHKSSRLLQLAVFAVPIVAALLLMRIEHLTPPLFTDHGVTPLKVLLEYVVMAVVVIALIRLRALHRRNPMVQYRQLQVSMVLTIVAEISFTAYSDVTSYANALGHILKLASYSYLFRSVVITDLLHPFRRLQTTLKATADILNSLPLGVLTFNPQRKLIFANNQAKELIGRGLADYYGQPHVELFSALGVAAPEWPAAGQTQSSSLQQMLEVHSENGATKLAIDIHEISGGGSIYLLSAAKQEQQLARLRLQTQAIVNSLDDIVLLLDKNNLPVMCNQAFLEITGLSPEQVIGKSLAEVYSSLGGVTATVVEMKLSRDLRRVQFFDQADRRRELLAQISPVHDLDGAHIGAVLKASDVTKLSQEEAHSHRQELLSAVGQMAAGLVHEIKNPLTTIKGFNQIMAGKLSEDLQRYSRIIDQEVDSLSQLVTDFLEFSKPRTPQLSRTTLESVIAPMRLMLESQGFLRGVRVTVAGEFDWPVVADEAQLRQVVLNISKNAFEAMAETPDPTMEVRCGCNDTHVELEIADNGPGIDPQELGKLWTPFYTTKSTGTGLGLPMCYQIVCEHGGFISVDSELGRGTRFVINLPVAERGVSGIMDKATSD